MKTFNNFLDSIATHNPDKLCMLVNYISPEVYDYIDGIDDYDAAITKLNDIYKLQVNVVFARHTLATRKQKPDESIDMYVQALRQLAKPCNFEAVSAETHSDEAIQDAMITGVLSSTIRQRLLEDDELKLDEAITKARAYKLAQENSEVYGILIVTCKVTCFP